MGNDDTAAEAFAKLVFWTLALGMILWLTVGNPVARDRLGPAPADDAGHRGGEGEGQPR